ncbi:short-chain dehydrogenase/reductase SDR [Lentzea sp. NBRC 105346]|uniref:SDR family oxidoreductase n=1 Tax=Lentzea sp. NBRC 105346 TaxID=3032205 RepID=UPI0024A0A344|nr:SDR family oxidoreductase [Lentzea sp. NBRC 105346]GLZ33738.1 short-chain dehydrogenase/reductase SDR [Lentzea sp. NBRC 105346]
MHAIITGGSSGIGLATARILKARGWTVSLIARGAARLEAAGEELNANTRAVDVSDETKLSAAIDGLVDEAGPCDALISCAGLARPGRFLELDTEVFRQMIEVDYFGTLYAIRAVAPQMVKNRAGSIVAVSSATGLLGIYGYSAYGPAKFAVRGLMESLRAELTPHGVHVGVVFPPDVDTPQLADENRFKPAETFAISGTIKPMTPEAVAQKIVQGMDRRRFLICPDTGTSLLARLGGLVSPVLNRTFDRRIARLAKKS